VAELVIRSTGAGLFITVLVTLFRGAGLSKRCRSIYYVGPVYLFRIVPRITYHSTSPPDRCQESRTSEPFFFLTLSADLYVLMYILSLFHFAPRRRRKP
jgi:hypothetical protein